MVKKLTFHTPTNQDLQFIADSMWHEDAAEMEASGNASLLHGLVYAVEQSKTAVVAKLNGEPLVIYGLHKSDVLSGMGVPWMITTTESKNHQREYMVYTRQVVEEMLTECTLLQNFVHAENSRSIKWLKALGFTIDPTPVFNRITGAVFHRFYLSKEPQYV